jgi:hypothetical protein
MSIHCISMPPKIVLVSPGKIARFPPRATRGVRRDLGAAGFGTPRVSLPGVGVMGTDRV